MPAPTRAVQRFPNSWGYAVGLLLIITGLAVGLTVGITGFRSLYDDVRSLQRNAQNGEILASLERGEYVIYDEEEGFDIGPADIRVVRESDGQVIPTVSTDNLEYDVDGRSGEAAASVRLPTDDFYRIEVNTGVGEVASFALGQDLGNGPGGIIARSFLWGAAFVIPGLALLIYTGVQHARWTVRTRLADKIDIGRETVQEVLVGDGDAADAARSTGATRLDQLTQRAQHGIERARAEVQRRAGTEESQSRLQREFAERATEAIDVAETQLGSTTEVAGERLASGETDLAARLDTAMARVQDRLAAGDSLRDIARDERVQATETARELRERAQTQVADARTTAQDAAATRRSDLEAQVGDVGAEVGDIASGLGDDLTSTTAVAGAAAAAAVAAGVDDLVGADGALEDAVAGWGVDDGLTPPPPPPPPPPAAVPPPPPPAGVLEALGHGDLVEEPEYEPEPVLEPTVEEPEVVLEPIVEEPGAAPDVRTLAPPPAAAAGLAPPPTVAATSPGIAPPPLTGSILAPPPAAQLRTLASRAAVAGPGAPEPTEASEEADDQPSAPPRRRFALAPPPDYSRITRP